MVGPPPTVCCRASSGHFSGHFSGRDAAVASRGRESLSALSLCDDHLTVMTVPLTQAGEC